MKKPRFRPVAVFNKEELDPLPIDAPRFKKSPLERALNHKLRFGQYRGLRIREVLKKNFWYLHWLMRNDSCPIPVEVVCHYYPLYPEGKRRALSNKKSRS